MNHDNMNHDNMNHDNMNHDNGSCHSVLLCNAQTIQIG